MVNFFYLDKNPIKKRIYERRTEHKKVFTYLQKELENLGIHKRTSNGQNIVNMTVEGRKSKSGLKVYLIHRQFFPEMKNFNSNKSMKIDFSS